MRKRCGLCLRRRAEMNDETENAPGCPVVNDMALGLDGFIGTALIVLGLIGSLALVVGAVWFAVAALIE